MWYFVLFFVCLCVNSSLGQLEVVSDLLPIDCLLQKQTYVEFDTDYDYPYCKKGISAKRVCDAIFNRGNVRIKPTGCLKDGFFDGKQCKGEVITGRCFCFDKNGKRLFGEQWWSKADDMTCGCSRRKADLQQDYPDISQKKYIFFNTLHCDSMGNYESLQCDVISAQCWCADSKTGKLVSSVVPQISMSKLPCYHDQTVGAQYLRRCESKKYAEKKIEYMLKLHGTGASFGETACDGDGAYGYYGTFQGSIYCTWRNNDKLGSYQFTGNKANLNCNCAHDKKLFELAGKLHDMECDGGGSYKRAQYTADSIFCIDKDGFMTYENSNDEVTCDALLAYDELP